MGTRWMALMAAGALFAAASDDAEAQRRGHGDFGREGRPGGYVTLNFLTADPVGEFGQLVDVGFGGELQGILPVSRDGALSLKLDAGFLIYGHERAHVCFGTPIGCRIDVDLVTQNDIAYAGFGPEIALPYGPVRPYVNGTAGFSYFFTRSSLQGDYHDDFGGTTHFDDFVPSFTAGGGLKLVLRGGHSPILLDLGLKYHRNGVTEYLREGDIVDHPDGSITLYPNRTEANLMTYRIGVSFGVGGDRGRRR